MGYVWDAGRAALAAVMVTACSGAAPTGRSPSAPAPASEAAPDAMPEEAAASIDVLTVADVDGPGSGDGVEVATGTGDPRAAGSAAGSPSVRLTMTKVSVTPDTSSLNPDDVRARIEDLYQVGLVRCYKEAGSREPSTLTFDVASTGLLTQASVTQRSEALRACLEGRMRGWRFAIPTEEGDPAPVTVRIDLAAS